MPQINFTIPDTSPIITYHPPEDWSDESLAADQYTNDSFHYSTAFVGAYAEFSFNGTGLVLYGAIRGTHDLYNVTIDGQHTFTGDGRHKTTEDLFNQTLYDVQNLTYGTHVVQLINAGGNDPGFKHVDLDWVSVITGDGDAATPNNDIWLDNKSENFTWSDGWRDGQTERSSQYYQETFALTATPGAKASLSFYGNGVQIYGATAPDYGGYSVSLDGGDAQPYKSAPTPRIFRSQQLLYMAAGLPTGLHTVTYTNTGTNSTDIDYAIVSQYNVPQDPNTGPQPAKVSSSAGTGAQPTATSTSPSGSSGTPSPSTTSHTARSRTIAFRFLLCSLVLPFIMSTL